MITTSYRPSEHTIKTAKQLSKELNMPFCGRNKQTVENLLKSAERDLLVVGKERFELYTKQGAKFFFIRIQRCSELNASYGGSRSRCFGQLVYRKGTRF